MSFFQKPEFLAAHSGGKRFACQCPNVKRAGTAAIEDETFFFVEFHLVKEPEALDFVWCLIALAHATLENRQFVNLAIVLSRLFLVQGLSEVPCSQISCNAESIRTMRSGGTVFNAGVPGEIAISVFHLDVGHLCRQTFEKGPVHHAHESFRAEGLPTQGLELDFAAMESLVAGFVQCDEAVGSIATCSPVFDVMYIECEVFRLSAAMLTVVIVPERHVFTNVPETGLVALLILPVFNVRVLDLLNVGRSCFHRDGSEGMQAANRFLLFEKAPCLCRLAWHQRFASFVQNKYSQVLSPRSKGRLQSFIHVGRGFLPQARRIIQ